MENSKAIVPGMFTLEEIHSQPEVWGKVLDSLGRYSSLVEQFFQKKDFNSVLFTGCGSTYYLSLSAAATFQELTGIPAHGLPASEIWLNQPAAYSTSQRPLLIAVSRSGESTETVCAVEEFKRNHHGKVMTLTCYPESTLSKMGDINLAFPEAGEESVAQTRAFSSLHLACTALAIFFACRHDLLAQLNEIPPTGARLIERYATLAKDFGQDLNFDRFYFLGSGARYGIACEASLKMKEMSLSHSEPFHVTEFRHGPMSMLTRSTLLVGLLGETNFAQENRLIQEMQSIGARTLTFGDLGTEIELQSGVDEVIRPILYLPVLQLLAFERALRKGLNPDLPHNLSAVVRLS